MEQLLPLVYDELRRLAARALRGERPNHTLSPTALVHEAWLELAKLTRIQWQNRSQFLALAAQAMRRVLIDYAVARRRLKRGGGQAIQPFDQDTVPLAAQDADDLIALEDALARLMSHNTRHARIVECRFYGGMSIEETAEALGTSPATIKRDWAVARAWLNRELRV